MSLTELISFCKNEVEIGNDNLLVSIASVDTGMCVSEFIEELERWKYDGEKINCGRI